MTSTELCVQFDAETHEPRVIVHRETNQTLTLVPESAFRLELDKLKGTDVPPELASQSPSVIIDARQCEIIRAEQRGQRNSGFTRTVSYKSPLGRIDVKYTLAAGDHFIQKRILFKPAFSESYLLRRVNVQQFRFQKPPKSLIAFRHGRCITHFVRREKSGFFFGVQVPIEVNVKDPAASIGLGYEANYRYPSREPYMAETAFWGVYRPTRTFAPPVPARIDECRNSTTPPDLGESAAMLAMVRRLTNPVPEAVSVNYNSWEGKLSRNGYGARGTAADVAQDKKVLSLAKEQFGKFYTLPTIPWGGMGFDMPQLGPDAAKPLTSPLQRDILKWAREQKIDLHTWAPLKSICPWLGVHRYAPNHEPWWGHHENVKYNCPANREYMAWFTDLLVAQIRRDGFRGYALDEYMPQPRTGLPCTARGHDHVPGDASYGYFVARRDLFRKLRREFGKEFHLQAARPNMDAGIWDALYADYVFTISEAEKAGGDEIRYRSRVRHFYHFVPSNMDQVYFRPNLSDDIDYLILSALAVSNRHCVHGLGRDATERRRIRHWYDWARARKDLMMGQVVFLPNWPGGGKCDGYIRVDGSGSGYAFVFNANDEIVKMQLPLDERCGLTAGNSYRVQCEFPESRESWTSRGQVGLTVPARQVMLLSIRQETDDSAKHVP
jgi:hypothetical protein